MTEIQKSYFDFEEIRLSKFAARSSATKGRLKPEPTDEADIRTPFMRDRDRIIHCKAFRRLMHKTQCFLSPEGDHYRTRLTHTLEVSQIARTVARSLGLNEDLTEAASLGHDLGHTPFGHAGERILDSLCSEGFKHNEQSLRVVDILEKDGAGLNLTYEVRNAIFCHTGELKADTLEGRLIKFADRIAYINHDIDDAVRAGVLSNDDIPSDLRNILGDTHRKRIDVMVKSLIYRTKENFDRDIFEIEMHSEIYDATMRLREFLFKNVYFNPVAKSEESKAGEMLKLLYDYYKNNYDKIPEEYRKGLSTDCSLERAVCDYLACMSDRYAVLTFENLFIPKKWNK
ncbi:MAG: deoxyguanosinetriphosphate triphosphohydrolase [Clostridiales bacterium]|nr:MAG: deoxyguanosinetriphosphate triphosphohydrolase [Clostridiales bacterium]